MNIASKREQPRTVTSRRSIRYRESGWRVHKFELRSDGDEVVCRAVALHMAGSLLLWVGAGEGAPRLASFALGVPAPVAAAEGGARSAALLGGDETSSVQLARRLAAGLARPVYVCCGADWERRTAPTLERALLAEMKRRS